MVTKGKYAFEEWEETSYNAKYDMYGINGVDVFLNGANIGTIDFITESEIELMNNDEVEVLVDNYLGKPYKFK